MKTNKLGFGMSEDDKQIELYDYFRRELHDTIPICKELKDKMEERDMIEPDILVDAVKAALKTAPLVNEKTGEEETWVWVTGYKGLDKDMKAYNNFQYEMDQLYIMPDGEPVTACHGGFHLCLKLEDLYRYKPICKGNRFFECKALVRERDLEKYGATD